MSSVPIMVSDGRRVCGRRRGREDKSGRAERDGRNSKSAKSHGDIPFRLATQQRRGNTPLAPERYATPQMKPPSQVGNGENYPSIDSHNRAWCQLDSSGVRPKTQGGLKMLDLIYQPRPLVNQSPNLGVPNIDVSRLEPECPVNARRKSEPWCNL